MTDLTLTYIQYHINWEQKRANFQKLEALMSSITSSDIILLPEMFSTGFSMEAAKLAEPTEGETLTWMQRCAQKKNAAICGSIITEDAGKYYNRLFWVEPDGSYQTYDKHHLFTLANEQHTYSAGSEHLIVHYRGWKIKPLICYDLRFPVWCRNTQEADLMLFVANWPHRRSEAWKTLLKARAIENMCYVAGVNRVGDDGNGVSHSGDSVVHDALGEIIAAAKPFTEEVKTVVLSPSHIQESRERFSFLRDRDSFTIN